LLFFLQTFFSIKDLKQFKITGNKNPVIEYKTCKLIKLHNINK